MQIRVRKDLQTFPRGAGPDAQWIVKDPVSFSHFLFSPEEIFLLNLFDGKRTLEQIRSLWQSEFQTTSLTRQQLEGIADRFVRDNLVVVDHFGTGRRLHEAEGSTKRGQLLMKLSSPLVIKIGGVDPGEILRILWLPGQILFGRLVVFANLLIACLVLVYFIGHFEVIVQRAANMTGFFAAKNLLVMTLIIVVVKIVHELGHAVACQKFGGECFEIGVLLLAFFPTLYCDVTDSWTFADRWKRIMVSFAGIYIEIILATISAVLWLLTGPGLANSIFFNIVVMCSVNTLFINGNPLLRYDGYYILSDLFEQPNLSQNARSSLRRAVSNLFFDQDTTIEQNNWLTLFGLLSMLYRWFVVLSICVGVLLVLKSLNFGILSECIVFLLLGTVGFRMLKQSKLERQPIKRRINLMRSFAVLTILCLAGVACFCLPLPSNVYCNFAVESAKSSIVYSPKDGKLDLAVMPYDQIDAGQNLGRIINLGLEEQREQTVKRLKNLDERAKRLVRRFDQASAVASEVQLINTEIEKVQAQLEVLEDEQKSLTLSAANGGLLRPITMNANMAYDSADTRMQLSGTLFDAENRDCFVSRGQPLFILEGPEFRLVSYLGEKDVEFLAVGQHIVVAFNQSPAKKLVGTIEAIVETEVKLNEYETASSGMETFIDQSGETQTLQTPYRVIMKLEGFPSWIMVGSNGRARISVANRTLAQKVWFVLDRWWKEQNY